MTMIEQQLDEVMCAMGLQETADRMNGKAGCGVLRTEIKLALPEHMLECFGVRIHPDWIHRLQLATEVDSSIGKSRWIANTHMTCEQLVTSALHLRYTGEAIRPPAPDAGWYFPTPQQERRWRRDWHEKKLNALLQCSSNTYGVFFKET